MFVAKGHDVTFLDVRVWEDSKERVGGLVVNTTDATVIKVHKFVNNIKHNWFSHCIQQVCQP
jgi:hypothetical protein